MFPLPPGQVERNVRLKNLCEPVHLPPGTPDLQFGVGAGRQGTFDRLIIDPAAKVLNDLEWLRSSPSARRSSAAPTSTTRRARREASRRPRVVLGPALRWYRAMHGDDRDLLGGEVLQVAVQDQVHGCACGGPRGRCASRCRAAARRTRSAPARRRRGRAASSSSSNSFEAQPRDVLAVATGASRTAGPGRARCAGGGRGPRGGSAGRAGAGDR